MISTIWIVSEHNNQSISRLGIAEDAELLKLQFSDWILIRFRGKLAGITCLFDGPLYPTLHSFRLPGVQCVSLNRLRLVFSLNRLHTFMQTYKYWFAFTRLHTFMRPYQYNLTCFDILWEAEDHISNFRPIQQSSLDIQWMRLSEICFRTSHYITTLTIYK